MRLAHLIFILAFYIHPIFSQDQLELDSLQWIALIDSIENSLQYESGKIDIVNNDAYIEVPEEFKFLDAAQAEYVLTEIWGNPPSDIKPEGMLVPAEGGVINNFTYAIEITYSEEGYINDEDAKDIDYDELLDLMQEDAVTINEQRKAEGYPTAELIGWATPPHYNEDTKKLYWAKEIKFEGETENTLNYNIRILGRKGLINLNAIGYMDMLNLVEKDANKVLASVHYKPGSQYKDFNPDLDKVAAVGIGGLIAGKVLTKAGILAKLGILLAKFWKIILLAIIGFGTGIRKLFGGKKQNNTTQNKNTSNKEEGIEA